jgi:hypothetical protein
MEVDMIQVEARPSIGEAPRPAGASRRPVRIVAPTASGRRWRTAGRCREPGAEALATALGPTHCALSRSAFASR